jgi:NitT/TauT family transport system ATP-binding protein
METVRAEVLSIDGLNKKFGDLHVLNDISFKIYEGELIAVLGPSGCGKTTLLRSVAGLLPFSSGRILLRGSDIAGLQSSDIGVVFQEPRLLPWRTTYENIRLPFELNRNHKEVDAAIDSALEMVGLSEFKKAYPHELSGGMRSRVSLARALAPDPRILLMDEPLTGLDIKTREELQDEIISIWKQKKVSLIWVTHSPEEAVYLADRVIILSSRPTRIKDILTIDLPRPRSRYGPEIDGLNERIRELFQ